MEFKMKTFLTMLSAMFMTFAVIGCGGGTEDADTADNSEIPDAAEMAEEGAEEGGEEGGEEKPAEGGEETPAEGGEEKPAEGGEEKPAAE